ncbi:hypothetical protein AR543_21065 [Paenibacillus bovis]|uniref:Uncharacterized protein n=2 Tax=Paenibacillus bovis TaxID=1616788 RepID=A0A172ZNK7_9BACL|nr:hypothetical protein AR543_21065 [Paenibacillus bovis]
MEGGINMANSPSRLPLKRKFIAVLLAAILPGFGHIYLGLAQKGIQFIALLLLDITALVYFTSQGIQINLPFLGLLALLVPVIYFYNVYDVLQSTDWINEHIRAYVPFKKKNRPYAGLRGISFGLLLILEGTVICILLLRPYWLRNVVSFWGGYLTAFVCLLIGILLLTFQGIRIYRALHKGSQEKTGGAIHAHKN